MYVYGENSILVQRFSFKELANKCGKPVGLSQNGLSLVFQKSEISKEIYIVEMSINGLKVIKKINLKSSIEIYLQNLEQ